MQRRSFISIGLTFAAASFFPWSARAEGSDVLLRTLNAHRQDMGIAPLSRDPALTEMSRQQAFYMHKISHATHIGPDGSDPIERGVRSGYEGRILGEALAESVEGARDTLKLWMGHDETRAVLLDSEAREVGLSCIGDRRVGPVHWDLVLGA